MRTLQLEPGQTPREWGRAHGESFAGEVRELAAIRIELIRKNWQVDDTALILERAERHLEPLQRFDAELYEEMLGIAEGAGATPAEVVVLNHYTDLRDLNLNPANEEGCTAVYARNGKGVFLGQTWDMHATAAPFVMMLKVPEPEMWVLTITGCLALSGLSRAGVGVTINNLISKDAVVGVIWPALVRKMLSQPRAHEAWKLLTGSPVGSGHHYIIADTDEVYGVETSGVMRKTIYRGESQPYFHTNHCLDDEVAALHQVSPTSTTHDRYRLMREHLDSLEEPGLEELWQVLGSKEEYPRSLFTNMATPENPAGMFTCARVMMDLGRRQMLALPGLDGNGPGETFDFG